MNTPERAYSFDEPDPQPEPAADSPSTDSVRAYLKEIGTSRC